MELTKEQMEELHSIVFYARQSANLDETEEGLEIETLTTKWDNIFYELTKK